MMNYEMLTILPATLSDEAKEATIDKYIKMIESNGGKMTVVNKWGVKKFAYPINYKNEGYYVLLEFEADAKVPALLDANMRIDESVVRSLCLKK
ncbi:MAG: 30S ribosomal protein S6 [Clostridiales bacterium]|nr:30S ribosomal protein S6 [Clostridiales bacterium]